MANTYIKATAMHVKGKELIRTLAFSFGGEVYAGVGNVRRREGWTFTHIGLSLNL